MKPIHFEIVTVEPSSASNMAYLVADNWNDWFEYTTMFSLIYFDQKGNKTKIGAVKIGEFNMQKEKGSPSVPSRFERLGPAFFSLGQDASYYSSIMELGGNTSRSILSSLNDIAADESLYQKAIKEAVTEKSLMRSISKKTVEEQFRRILSGGSILTEFRFRFDPPRDPANISSAPNLEFSVRPESRPPTNIHVLIGRNGVGKSQLLNSMKQAILGNDTRDGSFVSIGIADEDIEEIPFAGLVSVEFSAFDDYRSRGLTHRESSAISYSYIGLRKEFQNTPATSESITLSPAKLAKEFADSIIHCAEGAKADRLDKALSLLESDPIFADEAVSRLRRSNPESLYEEASGIFQVLSSGHKMVLLAITKLVEHVEEKTLVLIDEPEAHLHPPLLAAFMRALSELLINRNGVAIVATHSPVVLQEVPRSCVWKILRSGSITKASRPSIETFAENVSVLTDEVFRLELTKSGFYKMLQDASATASSVNEVAAMFDCQIGSEGYALIASMIAGKKVDEVK